MLKTFRCANAWFDFGMQVLRGITDQELDVLDSFEDVEYERRAVEVSLVVSGFAQCSVA